MDNANKTPVATTLAALTAARKAWHADPTPEKRAAVDALNVTYAAVLLSAPWYYRACTHTGTVIGTFATIREASEALLAYEAATGNPPGTIGNVQP